MATTLAALLTSCRILSGDGTVSNLRRRENLNNKELGNDFDGATVTFNVSNFPVAPGGFVQVWADNSLVSPAAVHEALGQFTLAIPPRTSVYASYYYYLFSDAEWTEIVTTALEKANYSSGDTVNDVPKVPEGALAAVKIYANAFFCMKVASQTGLWYNQRLQERIEDRDNVSAKYAKRANDQMKIGYEALQQFWTDRIQVPSMAIVEHQPLPYTPFR